MEIGARTVVPRGAGGTDPVHRIAPRILGGNDRLVSQPLQRRGGQRHDQHHTAAEQHHQGCAGREPDQRMPSVLFGSAPAGSQGETEEVIVGGGFHRMMERAILRSWT